MMNVILVDPIPYQQLIQYEYLIFFIEKREKDRKRGERRKR
jgi:hypothetical protein